MHMHERPAGLTAGRAFLCAEAWQSGLLQRAYPSPDLWASNPLAGFRQFESDRFHHNQSSGAKAIISYRTGKRDSENTDLFIQDLRERIIGVPEISTDGFHPYKNAIRAASPPTFRPATLSARTSRCG